MTVSPEVLQKQHADTKLLVMTNMLGYANISGRIVLIHNIHVQCSSTLVQVSYSNSFLVCLNPPDIARVHKSYSATLLKRHQTKFTTPMRATPCKKLDHVTTVYTHICHISWEGTQQIWCNKTIWVNILYVFMRLFSIHSTIPNEEKTKKHISLRGICHVPSSPTSWPNDRHKVCELSAACP